MLGDFLSAHVNEFCASRRIVYREILFYQSYKSMTLVPINLILSQLPGFTYLNPSSKFNKILIQRISIKKSIVERQRDDQCSM